LSLAFFGDNAQKDIRPTVGKLVLLSGMLGFLWGILVSPVWNEMVESGLALSGQVDAYIPYFVSDFSIQITLPAILFKLGATPGFMALFTSGVCASIAFAAVSALVLLFSDSFACSILAPVFLCKFPFYNFHYYPVKFPIYNYIFGQFGFYAAVLVIALLALGKKRSVFLLSGLMVGIHLPWALGVYLFAVIYFTVNRCWPSVQSRLWIFFVSGLVISILLGAYHQLILKPEFLERQGFHYNALSASMNAFLNIEEVVSEMESVAVEQENTNQNNVSEFGIDEIFIDRKLRFDSNRGSHNLLFSDSPQPWLEAMKFFFIDILLFSSLLYLVKRPQPGLADHGRLLAFARALFYFQLLGVVYKLLDEIDPQWLMLGFIHGNLPGLLLRVIPNRWMNIDLILFPIIFFVIIFGYLEERKNIPALTALLVLAFMPWLPETDGHNYGFSELLDLLKFQLVGFTLAFLITTALVLVPALQKWQLFDGNARLFRFLEYGVFFFSLISIVLYAADTYNNGDYLRRKDESIVQMTRGREGILLPALGVQGYGNFNIFAQLNRPYYLPDTVLLPIPGNTSARLDVFCENGAGNTFSARRAWQAECWANRDKTTWHYIADQLYVSQVITRSDVYLKLPLLAASRDFHVYEID
jgi:hypothetical protein